MVFTWVTSKIHLNKLLVTLPWASCQIPKIAFSPPPRVSDPDMHHGTCVTHVPWCMPGSLTNGFLWSRWWGKTFPAFPAHAQPTIFAYLVRGPCTVMCRVFTDKVFPSSIQEVLFALLVVVIPLSLNDSYYALTHILQGCCFGNELMSNQ